MTKRTKRNLQNETRAGFSLERLTLYLLAGVVFALPLFIWPGITEYGYGKTIIALVTISLLTILRAVDGARKDSWTIRVPWITGAIVGLVLASLLSLIHAMNGRVVIQSLALLVFFYQFVMLTANLVRDQRDANLLLGALLVSSVFVSLYGLLQYLGVLSGPTGGRGINEVISTLGNRNYLGGFLTYLLFPSVILVVRLKSPILRALSILMIAFGFGTALMLQQTAVVVLLIGTTILMILGILAFRAVAPLKQNRIWLIILFAVLALTYLVEAPSGPLNSLVGLSDDAAPSESAPTEKGEPSWLAQLWARNSGAVRSWDWWVGWEMFKDHPITGVGLGNYKLNFIPYKAVFLATPRGAGYDFYIPRAAQAHNDYVQAAAELGLLGCLAVAALLGLLVYTIWIRLRRNPDENARFDLLLLLMGLIAFLGHGLISFPVHLPASMLVVLVLTGLIYSPIYGSAGVKIVRLGQRASWGALVAVCTIGIAVSIVGARDLVGNFYMGEGQRQLQVGQARLAEATLRRSIALDFAPRQTYFQLAGAQMLLGQAEDALVSLRLCLSRFTDESAYLLHADVASGLGKLDEAQASIDLLLASRPSNETRAKARYIQASLYVKAGQVEAAIQQLNDLLVDAPEYELAHIALGSISEARGLLATAQEHYERAIASIDLQLERIEDSLSGRTTIPYGEYASLRQSSERLTQQREAVLARLSDLSTP